MMPTFIPGFHDQRWQDGPPLAWLACYDEFEAAIHRYTPRPQDSR